MASGGKRTFCATGIRQGIADPSFFSNDIAPSQDIDSSSSEISTNVSGICVSFLHGVARRLRFFAFPCQHKERGSRVGARLARRSIHCAPDGTDAALLLDQERVLEEDIGNHSFRRVL